MRDLLDLSGVTAERLICDVTGVDNLQELDALDDRTEELLRRPTRGSRERVTIGESEGVAQDRRATAHRVLYTLTFMRGSAILDGRLRTRRVRLLDDSLAALPQLPNLEDRKSRPLIDEEVALCRLLLEIDIEEEAGPRNGLSYLLAESGIRGIESTSLDTDALDHPLNPTEIQAPGAWEFGRRTVDLTPYATRTMPALLRRLRSGVQPLTYTGDAPGQLSATSSITGVLMRHLRRAGIRDELVTPKSLNLWRPLRALLHSEDVVAARRYHGGATINLLADLNLVVSDDLAVANGTVDLRRATDDVFIARVPTEDYNDGSATLRGGRRRAP